MAKFSELRFASKVVIMSVMSIVLYIIADIIILLATGSEPAITPYVFGFFGGELTLLAAKRIFVKEATSTSTSTAKSGTSTVVTTKVEAKG